MVKLLSKALRKQQKDSDEITETRASQPQAPAEARDRILVLVPSEGGFAFRLLAFPSTLHAAAYVNEHFPQRTNHLFTFRPHHDRPRDPAPGTPGQVEAVVMVRDPDRHGTVHLYSFVDMDTAHAFVRAEGMRGLSLPLVLVFWAEPIALNLAAAVPQDSAYVGPPPQSELGAFEQPRNPVFGTLTGASDQSLAPDQPREPEPAQYDEQPAVPAPEPPSPPPPVQQHAAPAVAPPLSLDSFAPPQAAAPASTSYTTQTKQPRRWNAGDAAPQPQPSDKAPVPQAPVDYGTGISGQIRRIRNWPGWDGFGPILVGASILKWEVYDEARKDPYAAGRASVIVGSTVAAAALSAFFGGPLAFFFHGLFMALGWALYALCIYLIGTQLFGGAMERGETNLFLQRIGLAFAPGPLVIFGIIPIYGPMFVLCALIWVMVTSIKATEISLELDRQSAALTAIISWLALFAVAVVIPSLAT